MHPTPGHGHRVKVYKSIHGVTWFRDDPLPDVKTRVVMDGWTYRWTRGLMTVEVMKNQIAIFSCILAQKVVANHDN